MIGHHKPNTSIPDPLVAPLRDPNYLVDKIADVSGKPRQEVIQRLYIEHQNLGTNVQEAIRKSRMAPHIWSQNLIDFYNSTDAFLYESTAWNRCHTKLEMRRSVAGFLQNSFPNSARILTFGDGLGFDSLYLAAAGYQVDYLDCSAQGALFAKQICSDFGHKLHILASPEDVRPQTYDAVICLDVLEHVPDPVQTVAFLASALREYGHLLTHSPFWYLTPSVATHLASNRRYSGDTQLFRQSGLRPVDSTWFWNPLVLCKSYTSSVQSLAGRCRIQIGGFLLSMARVWSTPHAFVWRTIYRRHWQPWTELAELAAQTPPLAIEQQVTVAESAA